MRLPPRLLLPTTLCLAVTRACVTDVDCQLNGACGAASPAVCACNPGWLPPDCGELKLAPMDPAQGYNHLFESDGNISSSWGGRALPGDRDGLFHLFFSYMMNHCTIRNYTTNSACAHGVGASPLGPFNLTDIVMGPECHNAMPMRGPAGEWLVWHIGSGNRKPVQCQAGGDGPEQRPPSSTFGAPGGDSGVGVLSAPSPYGPWTRVTGLISNGEDGAWDSGGVTNPAPMLLPNGSVLLAYRGRNATVGERLGIAVADSWRGPYAKLTREPITTVNSEDPFLFRDVNHNLHILYHAFDEGGHAFSPAGRPTEWTTAAVHAYNRTIHWVNGTQHTVVRRERPQLLTDVDGTPMVLWSGVVVAGTSVYGPAFTSAQEVRK